MKILIVGCGKIGGNLLNSLVGEGHDIVAIVTSFDVITELTNIYDIMGVCGNGVDSDILDEAGVSKADLFIAVTGSDEFNMLSCYMAKRMGATRPRCRDGRSVFCLRLKTSFFRSFQKLLRLLLVALGR